MTDKTFEIEYAEMKDNDMAKKMSSDMGYAYTFYQDRKEKTDNAKLTCGTCAKGMPTPYKLNRTDSEGTEIVLEGYYCSHYCCAFDYLPRAEVEDKNAAQQIETSVKTRIKTLKNAEGSAQAKTLQEMQSSEITRHVLAVIGEDMKQEQTEKYRIGKFLEDIKKQGFAFWGEKVKKEGDCCGDCQKTLDVSKEIDRVTLAFRDSSHNNGKTFAIIEHCGRLDCLLETVLKIPQLSTVSEEDQENPVFKFKTIVKTWEMALMNNRSKAWLQNSLQQIEEIDKLVQEKEKLIYDNESSTEEEVEKFKVAVQMARELKDKLNAFKRKTAGDMSQRANNSRNFREKVDEIVTTFEELKKNLEETEDDRILRAKNDELQKSQNLSNAMNDTIALLKVEAATLAKKTAFARIQKLEQVTNAIEMKAIADAKNLVSDHRQTSDAKIQMQTQLAMEVATVSIKLNELGLPWLNVPVDQSTRTIVLLDPLGKETIDALRALTDMTSKVVQAKAEQRNATKQLLQIKLDERERIKREEKNANEQQKDSRKSVDTELETLRKENEALKQQAKTDSNEIAEKKTRIALLESTIEKNKIDIAKLNETLTETNQLMETLLETNGRNEDTNQNKRQKRGDKGTDHEMNNQNENKKSKNDDERRITFAESDRMPLETQLDNNPGTPIYSPDRNATTPPKTRLDNSDANEPQYSPCSDDKENDDDKMPELENSQSSTTNTAIERSKTLLEKMRKSTATEDGNWQNVDRRNSSSKRDGRDDTNRRPNQEKQQPVYGGNYGPQNLMPQWGPQPGPMTPQWLPVAPPPGWPGPGWPPGNWVPQERQYHMAQSPNFVPMPQNDRNDRGSGRNERDDSNNRKERSDRNDRTDRSDRNDRYNNDRNDRDQPRSSTSSSTRFDKRDCNYWLSDMECPRGDQCSFLHIPNKRGTQMNAVERFKEYQSKRPPRKD